MMTSPLEPDGVIPTPVPGIVLWRYPRRTITQRGTGTKARSRTYSVTHEPSGHGLLAGVNGIGRHVRTIAAGVDIAVKLGDLRYRRKPVDWTQPIDQLETIKRVRTACFVVSGFFILSEPYEPAIERWAQRNSIDLHFKRPTTTGGQP